MTRPSQTADEGRHTKSFFRSLFGGEEAGLVFEFPAPPAPDVLVRGVRLTQVAGAAVAELAVEHTEYHPAAWGCETYRRTEVDLRWETELLPAIEAARQANPAIKTVAAKFDFKDFRLPKKRDHHLIAEDFIRAVESALPQMPQDQWVFLLFINRDELSRIPYQVNGVVFLPLEDFPIAAEHFDYVKLAHYPDAEWPLWSCPRMLGGWVTPSANEFGQILEAKARKARKYDTQGRPVWLLIVAELWNDRESHIFPREEYDLISLREQIRATSFDFTNGPFQQVWLFSEFAEGTVRLYPNGSVVP